MSDNNNTNNSNNSNNKQQYPFYIHDQYVKDLSFENPNVLLKYTDVKKQPFEAASPATSPKHAPRHMARS